MTLEEYVAIPWRDYGALEDAANELAFDWSEHPIVDALDMMKSAVEIQAHYH